MLIIAAILIALIIPLLVVGLSFTHLRTGLLWILVLLAAISAWLLVIFARQNLPIEVSLLSWPSELFFGSPPALLIDNIAWSFAVAVMTLSLAVLLTDVVNIRELDPQVWASSLALGGVGLLTVVAGNPLTLLLCWSVLDISELVVLLIRVNGSSERERVVVAFSVRVLGILLLMAALLQVQSLDKTFSFTSLPIEVTGILLLASGFRLGVIPPVQPNLREPYLRRGLGSFARLVPVASSLVLGMRVATVGISSSWLIVFSTLATTTILYASIKWVRATDELQGRSYWILGFAALALVAAAHGLVRASAAWGYALFFSGSALFLFSYRQRSLLVFPVLGLIGFCALPITPAWEGIGVFASIPWAYRIVLLIALALYFVGYVKHARSFETDSNEGFERWMWLVYPLGLVLLPVTHFGLVYLLGMQNQSDISISVSGGWYGAISLGLASILLFMRRRVTISPPQLLKIIENISLHWLFRFFWGIYRLLGRLIELFSKLLEGEGGVLWTLLVLILLVVSLSLINTGGGFEF